MVLYVVETLVEVEADEAEELCVGHAQCGSTQIQLAVAALPERPKAAPSQ